ncbi:hypothetical protein AC579_10097 [Pseudocercospora musae]|uniref:Uncharacterized protein n=1 Tax=Pseudocercospora musae TaxID=113226 RepID=A0A139I299_9PEZI|nr:hypothetical protein AC579_10097 [Pseudocercospora musae]
MIFGTNFSDSAKSLNEKASLATSNAVSGFNFNRNVYKEFNKEPCNFLNEDFECDEGFGSGEEWTAISKARPRKKYPQENCLVKSDIMKPSDIGFTFTQHAITAASQAAGVSFDYAQTALRYATLETAQAIGHVANSETATTAIQKIKRHFPLLKDIQRAYNEGQEVQRSRNLPRDTRPMMYEDGEVEKMTDPETGAEVDVVYDEVRPAKETPHGRVEELSGAEAQEEIRGEDDEDSLLFRGSPLDYSGPIIGPENDSEELKAKEGLEAL